MTSSDGKKRNGRFIKNGSSIFEKVSLQDFSFDDISEQKTITPDNTKKNVIHAPYHEPEELESAVQPFRSIQQDLMPANLKRPILIPLDLSRDWERDRLSRRNRGTGNDDDEDFDYEDAMAQARATREASKKAGLQPPSSLSTQASVHEEAMELDDDEETRPSSTSSDFPGETTTLDPAELRPFPSQMARAGLNWGSIDVASKAINDLGHKVTADMSSQLKITPDTAKAPVSASEFIPAIAEGFSGGEPQDPEYAASQAYKSRVAEKQIDHEELRRAVEEEKAGGYRDGFRIGEEKAELQVRAASKEMLGKLEGLISEFGTLQKTMMDSVQENFFIVCQALAESLLKREFTIHPDAFNAVMERAITEAIEPGKVKVRVHPDTFERISSLGKSPFIESLVKDAEVAPGDFKLESHMSVVDVNIGKLVAQLLSQADLSLFDEQEKAG